MDFQDLCSQMELPPKVLTAIEGKELLKKEERAERIELATIKTAETLRHLSELLQKEHEDRIREEKILKRQNIISLGIAILSALAALVAAGFQIADFFINC